MAIEGVIFDFGHTLMAIEGSWPAILDRGMADLASFLSRQQLKLDTQRFVQIFVERRLEGFNRAKETMREVTAEEVLRWTFAYHGLPDPEPALVGGALDAFFSYEETCWYAYPDAHSVLRHLALRGLRLGLFSNATHDPFIQKLVDGLGFRSWLDPALSSAGIGIRKPDPGVFSPFLTAWGLPPDSVVMVGDTLDADILGAQRAGIRSVWFRSRRNAGQEESGIANADPHSPIVPDATIDRLGQLPVRLRELSPQKPGHTPKT